MLYAFAYCQVAVLVRHWFEISLTDSQLEHGTRVELRLLDPQPHRGSESAAQRVVADAPVWRADLFDRIGGTPGAFEAAHFHPFFTGPEPSERHWDDAVRAAPWEWLRRQLADVGGIAAAAGVTLTDPAGESEQVTADLPAILAAAQSRAPGQCRSSQQCHAWTSDVTTAVALMLEQLARPDLLDRDYAAPWLR
ncbi:MAG: hypothetical protein J2P30_19070 [Actinobacteria bacterium]|nr:hypothetical protein [Actinomycetota bacterium]MBO0817233.1 hypothetical protein [Actinomycetota bacterium]